PVICTACLTTKLRASRLGVQRLRDSLAALLPRTEIAWLDASVEDIPTAPVIVGTEAVLHRVDAKLVAFLDLDQELFAHRVTAAVMAVRRDYRVMGPSEHGTGSTALVLAPTADALATALATAGPPGHAEGRLRIAVDPPRV